MIAFGGLPVTSLREPSGGAAEGRARRIHRAPKIEDVIDASRSPARRRSHGTGPDIHTKPGRTSPNDEILTIVTW
jgi:hypothetical protein